MDDYPCKRLSIFKSFDEFKNTIQEYAMKNGFMFITERSYKYQSNNYHHIIMSCMCGGYPRKFRSTKSKLVSNQKCSNERNTTKSMKIGCECSIEATIINQHNGIVVIDKCNWKHTNGCIPSQNLLNIYRSRSGDYYKTLSLYNKLRFKRLVELNRPNSYLLRFIKTIVPPNAIITNQTINNWKTNIMHAKLTSSSTVNTDIAPSTPVLNINRELEKVPELESEPELQEQEVSFRFHSYQPVELPPIRKLFPFLATPLNFDLPYNSFHHYKVPEN